MRDGIAEGFQFFVGRFQFSRAENQVVLRLLEFRNINHHSHHVRGTAMFVAMGTTSERDPTDRAVRPKNATLNPEMPCECGFAEFGLDHLLIFRNDVAEQDVLGPVRLERLIAEYLIVAQRTGNLAALEVNLPHAHLGRLQSNGQPRFAVFQCLLGLLPFRDVPRNLCKAA